VRPRRKPPQIPWRSSAGFTLVEFLVALFLFSLLSVALFGSVRVGAATWTRATSHADESGHSLQAGDLLRYLIGNAYPLFVTDNPRSGHVDFVGGESSMSFLSAAPMALGKGGRSRINLQVERRGERADLLLESRPELVIAKDTEEKARKPILSGASAVTFSYFGTTQPSRPPAWQNDWSHQTELPRLVRIQVRFQGHERRDWSDLTIAPRIAADVGCVLDQLTMRCEGR
jgi:prepilin-type N-terminal cleavage/methylation domain-containing protein